MAAIFHKRAWVAGNRKDISAEKLKEMTPAEIEAAYDEGMRLRAEKEKLEATLREAKMPWAKSLSASQIAHWAALDFWKAEEALALSFGKEPRDVDWDLVSKYHESISPFVGKYTERRELMLRAVAMRQLFLTAEPRIFVTWAETKGFAFPDALVSAVKARGPLYDYKSAYEVALTLIAKKEEEISRLKAAKAEIRATEKEDGGPNDGAASITTAALKMLYAMAVAGFDYDPDAKRNTKALPAIREALSAQRLKVDDNTIRDWLKRSAEVRPTKRPSLVGELADISRKKIKK